jgi:hypothetical protein
MKILSKCTLLLLPLLVLQGCNSTGTYRDSDLANLDKEYTPAPLYCYETIGNLQCYDEPIPGWKNRLINAYLPIQTVDHTPEVRIISVESLPGYKF